MTATTHTVLKAALEAADRGWHIFPLRPGSKIPAITNWQSRATTNHARIQRCWGSNSFNIGIACGPSDLVVVDLDVAKPGQYPPEPWAGRGVTCGADVISYLARHGEITAPPETFTVRTGRGGLHWYYQHPATSERLRNTAHKIGWLVDTRAHGGYVVGAGSVVDGRPYIVEHDLTPVELPPCLAALATQPQPLAEQPARPTFSAALATTTRRDRYLAAALRNESERVRTAPEGHRNRLLYIAALRLGELTATGLLDRQLVTHTLTEAALDAALPIREATATIASGLRAGEQNPRKVPA